MKIFKILVKAIETPEEWWIVQATDLQTALSKAENRFGGNELLGIEELRAYKGIL